jgi:hypothetical protein
MLFLTVTGLSALLAGAPTQMGIDEIRPGMVGVGRTVFEGTRVEEFKANIIGVLENIIGPHRNLILAKLEGGPLAHTGVIASMSGSPVYIDGKLIGAVSYALGSFSKEPIAGITPIAEMTDAASFGGTRPSAARVQVDFPVTRESLTAAFRKALNWNRPFADRAGDARFMCATSVDGLAGAQLGTLLRPIATPLAMSGFEPEVADVIGGAFQDQGFVPTGGGARTQRRDAGEGRSSLAMRSVSRSSPAICNWAAPHGHAPRRRPRLRVRPSDVRLGPTEFPMTRAYVYTVLPSLFSSMKLSSTGDVISTFTQDRATTIAGRLGAGPQLIR